MKAIHNTSANEHSAITVVLYPKDTEKWKQFTTIHHQLFVFALLFCIPKILKNESNSQRKLISTWKNYCCFVSQRYWKMKAIHNGVSVFGWKLQVVLYPKDTEKWKQFTTGNPSKGDAMLLFCIPKILKNESNSQRYAFSFITYVCCFVSQRYWKMKAIHNHKGVQTNYYVVVLYPKDTEKWKQFTTGMNLAQKLQLLFCIPKILKNESNSQRYAFSFITYVCCFVSQRYWKMKAIHNL